MLTFSALMDSSSGYKEKNLPEKWAILEKLYEQNIKRKGEDKIPKIIHQIWLGDAIPNDVYDMMDTIKNANAGYEYKLWTDTDAEEFEFTNKQLFKMLRNLGQKSDVLRYAILLKYGGIYLDTDFIGVKSFDELLHLDFYLPA